IRGDQAAAVTVISFDDLECPFCARMHQTLLDTLRHYGAKIRIVYIDNPITSSHPWAMHAAVDANCLAAQSDTAYWAYVDYIHFHISEIDGEGRNLAKSFESLDRIAREKGSDHGLDLAKVN